MHNADISFPLFGEGFVLTFSNHFSIFGFQVYFYGVILALGVLVATVYAMWRAEEFGFTRENILDYLLFVIPAAVIVSRLYYVAIQPETLRGDPLRIITGIRDGGLTIYGVVLGAVLGAYLCSRMKKLDFWSFTDLGAMGLLIGQSIGRWGNFVNRELFGVPTEVPWRMGLTTAAGTIYVHPTFLYESMWNTLGLVLLHIYSKQVTDRYKGQLFTFYLGWYGLGRIWVEALRDPSQNMHIFETIPVNMLVAILCVLGAIGANYVLSKRHREKAETKGKSEKKPKGKNKED